MNKELELWQFLAERLRQDRKVMLMVVATSSGSSPGREGYKMAVAEDGELSGSIGGGVMEVSLVETARSTLSERTGSAAGRLQKPARSKGKTTASIIAEQVHQKNSPHASGMICSGKQTVIFKLLKPGNLADVEGAIDSIKNKTLGTLQISAEGFTVNKGGPPSTSDAGIEFQLQNDTDFIYTERLGPKNDLYIIGGGHCALALSELMSRMDFYIRIFDDRPELNTIDKNRFAHEIGIIRSYEDIGEHVMPGPNVYVVVMTLGYAFDKIVIERLLGKDLKYFGVLGSKAKMATLIRELKTEGHDEAQLRRIRTPIGIPINSRTPEEIAISIAAEMIAVKNAAA